MLHRHRGSGAQLVGEGRIRAAPYRQWVAIAERERLILAAPDGVIGRDGDRGWNDCRAGVSTNPATDDVTFVEDLLAALDRDYKVDRRRVFVVGTSNGGHMALRIAMDRPKLAAAAAVVAASMPAKLQCAPEQWFPVLFMNGTAHPLSPYQGGTAGDGRSERGSVQSVEQSVEVWRRLAGASAEPLSEELPDSNSRDRSRVTRVTYTRGGRPAVVLYPVEGGGHNEPSKHERYSRIATSLLGPQNGDIEMADEIWRFFSSQSPRS